MVKLKAKLDQAKLKQIIARKQKLMEDNIKAVLKNEALPVLISRIMEGFDNLSERADQLPEDPTNPNNWRQEFQELLFRDLEETFVVSGKRIQVNIGDKEVLGYTEGETDSSDMSPLVWLVFYIEGLAGDWAFITPELYDERRGSGAFAKLQQQGRFGEGFLISKDDFFNEGWDRFAPFDTVRHPFSGFSPVDIFTEALDEFRLRPFIQKAIKAAAEGKKL